METKPREVSRVEAFCLATLFNVWAVFGRARLSRPILAFAGWVSVVTGMYFGNHWLRLANVWVRYAWIGFVGLYTVAVVSELVMMLVLTYILHITEPKWVIVQQWWRYCFIDFVQIAEMHRRVQLNLRKEQLEYVVQVVQEKEKSRREAEAVYDLLRSYNKQIKRLVEEGLSSLISPVLQSRVLSFLPENVVSVSDSERRLLADLQTEAERAALYKDRYQLALKHGIDVKFLELLHSGQDSAAIELVRDAEICVRLINEAQALKIPVNQDSLGQPTYRSELAARITVQRQFLIRQRELDGLRERVARIEEPAVQAHLNTLLDSASAQLGNVRAFRKAAYGIEVALGPKAK